MKNLSIPQVENLTTNSGTAAPNQFRIITKDGAFFKSYDTIIAYIPNKGKIILDAAKWNYSRTTGKYRNAFLRMDKKEIEAGIKAGTILLQDLN